MGSITMPDPVPWARPSNDDQEMHAFLHIVKAAGKLAAVYEQEGHGGRQDEPARKDIGKYLSDLIISSIRLANVTGIPIAFALDERIRVRSQQP